MNNMQKIVLVAAAFLLVCGGLIVAIYTSYAEREKIRSEVAQIQTEIEGYNARIDQRELKRKNKEEIEDVFSELVDILPQASPRQEDKILDALTSYAAQARVKFNKVVTKQMQATGAAAAPSGPPAGPVPGGPPKPQFGDAFQPTELRAEFEGTFANFMRFLNAVENNPSFLRVDEIQLSPIKSGERVETADAKLLKITIALTTFHYVVR